MITVINLIFFIICVFLAGGLSVYPLSLLPAVTEIPVHKLIGHITILYGLIGSIVYLKLNGAFNRAGLGYDISPNRFIRSVAIGMLAGGFFMVITEILLLLAGLHGPEPELVWSLYNVQKIILLSLLTGIIVAFIEETIFRGAIFTVLAQRLGILSVVLLTSLVYALVHFLKFPSLSPGSEIHWLSGLNLLANAFNPYYFKTNLDTFLTLFLLGIVLAQLRYYTGNIALSIGVHAGLVMLMKITREWTDYVPGSNLDFMVNNSDHQLGLLCSFILILVIISIPLSSKKLLINTHE